MIRVLLADDHALLRQSLLSMLGEEPDIAVVGEAGDGESALRQCHALRPDVVLMDVSLPDISGIDATRRLIAESASTRVLGVSSHMDQRFVTRMLEAGASGYVHKAAGRDELVRGIRAVAAGKSYLSQNIAAMIADSVATRHKRGENGQLGKRETEVLMHIAEGKTSAQIATQLNIAVGTVDVHRGNIMRKLDLHCVADLTKYAIREGLIAL